MTQEFDDQVENAETGGGANPIEILRFFLGCARKHFILSIAIFLVIAVPGVLLARMLPLQYASRARILVTNSEGIRTRVMDSGGNERTDELNTVQDRLLRLENLRRIVEQMNLEQTWRERNPPLLELKDKLRGGGLAKLSKEERIRALMGTVESRLSVSGDSYAGTLSIEGRWTDPKTAFELAETVKSLYLSDRLRAEVQVFEEVISILEQQKKDAGREIEQGLMRVEQAGFKPGPAASATGSDGAKVTRVETVREGGVPDPELVVRLDSVRRQIREVQEPWQRRLADLKLQLTDLSSHYGPKHPLVINQENRIEAASAPPPGLEALKTEEARLAATLDESSRPKERIVIRNIGKDDGATAEAGKPKETRVKVESSATLSTEQAKLIQAVNKYNSLVERIDRTRIELNMASTAFRYRFNVVQEPELPAGATKPKLRLFAAVGALAFGALLGLAIGPLLEMMSGKLTAPWQAKTLGIPLLGELYLSEEKAQ